MDFARTSLLKEEAAAVKPRTGLGGVTRGVVPPLTNTWKQDSRSRTGERERVNRRWEAKNHAVTDYANSMRTLI